MEYIIGDVHGCLERLVNLIAALEERGPISKLVFLGDYLDRGPHSKQTIEYLLNLSQKYDCVFIRGNHDDLICYILGMQSYTNGEYFVDKKKFTPEYCFEWFMEQGLNSTLDSYDILDKLSPDNMKFNVNLFRDTVPDTHKQFLNNTIMAYSSDKYIALHGYPSKIEHEILWGRFGSLQDIKMVINSTSKKIILGHTPVQIYGYDKPININNVILLDTLSFRDYGCLSAYCVDDESFISIS
jgi:serine/threonine protein phosphatase 1